MKVTRALCPNFTSGRQGVAIDMVVIHVTEGSAESVKSWFASPASKVSAHYMVCVDGTIVQFVGEENVAWHAGRIFQPTAPLALARPHVNPNDYSIGIEHEGTGKEPMTPVQLAASLSLVAEICERYAIPVDRAHIVGHREVYAKKTCPGAINVTEFVNALRPIAAAVPSPVPPRPRLVWSTALHDWLIVTRVVSDDNWEFIPLSAVRRVSPTKAGAPLSAMLTEPR